MVALTSTLIVLSLGMLMAAVETTAQLQESSVPGVYVPDGFDAEVFATGLNLQENWSLRAPATGETFSG